MKRIFISWISDMDIMAMGKDGMNGPALQALLHERYDRALLLGAGVNQARFPQFLDWCVTRVPGVDLRLEVAKCNEDDHGGILRFVREAQAKHAPPKGAWSVTYNLSSGTRAMSSLWLLLAKTSMVVPPPRLLESSKRGVFAVDIPFSITADLSTAYRDWKDGHAARVIKTHAYPLTVELAFSDIPAGSKAMQMAVEFAKRASRYNVPVLITGESGTGKELFAKAIHTASGRKGRFVAANCASIQETLFEAEFFGTRKGGYSGAENTDGKFVEADGGTLFLDELGELSPSNQTRLLRVLNDHVVQPVGGKARDVKPVDVRIVSATNRDLPEMMREQKFREDLFYRVATSEIHLPPFRDRGADRERILDDLLSEINTRFSGTADYVRKELSAPARDRLLNHHWPGNVRQLRNILERIAIWSSIPEISLDDVESLLPSSAHYRESILDRPLGDGFSIQEVVDTVRKTFIKRALIKTGGNQTQAARELGLSRQTLNNWMIELKISADEP